MSETQTTPILVNFNNKLDYKAAKFGFREVTDKETGVKTKRPAVELDKLPFPSVEGIVAILETGGKALDLLLEAVADVVIRRARDVINDSENITSTNFDYSTCDWNVIANLEKEDRRSAIPKELWEDFATDYVEIMPSLCTSNKEQCATAAKIFVTKYASVKAKKDVVEKLKLRLSLYVENAPRAGEFAEIIELLLKRADKLINAKEESLEDSLGF